VEVISAVDMIKKGIRKNTCKHLYFFNYDYGVVADIRECGANSLNELYLLMGNYGVTSFQFQKSIEAKLFLNENHEKLIFHDGTDWNTFETTYECIFYEDCTATYNR